MNLNSAAADRLTSLVLLALGVAMFAGGFTMDRLEIRRIHPASIPGLVPMMLGAAMVLCAVLLFLASRARVPSAGSFAGESQADVHAVQDDASAEQGSSWRNLLFAALYSVGYALVLVGNMPFALASAIYIAVFYMHFIWPSTTTTAQRAKQALLAVLFGGVGAYAIAALVQYGFLVRLP